MIDKLAVLVPDGMYHVYNRANGSERLFRNKENYQYFLKKYKEYISPFADTFCYCLLPNHFHFLIKIKPIDQLSDIINHKIEQMAKVSVTLQGFKTLEGLRRDETVSKFLTQQFSHQLNSYTQAFNKMYKRKGSLMMHPYKRILVSDAKYMYNIVRYIHNNPLEAGLAKDLQSWSYSSYSNIIENNNGFINATEVLSWYETVENFKFMQTDGPSNWQPG